MGLPKGRTNNIAGRPKHSEDLIIKEFRDELIQGLRPSLPIYLKELDKIREESPIKALYIYAKFLQLVVPKVKEIELSGDFEITSVKVNIIDGSRN